MSNIVALRRPQRGLAPTAMVPAIFAGARRDRHDAYWLKENAEVLQILAATEALADLTPYETVAKTLLGELRFFPQYYRMYLSIALDLQRLGMADLPIDAMAKHVVTNGLAQTEVSDMHRAEAQLLLARAGHALPDRGVQARLADFARQSALFALPNRRAAYDLTHVVFHAADYGRRSLAPDAARTNSLMFAGIVAFLDDDMDLLAEVAIALRLQGDAVPAVWDSAIAADLAQFDFEPGHGDAAPQDDYHAWLVQGWSMALAAGTAFAGQVPQGTRLFRARAAKTGTLRALSLCLMDMGAARNPDWDRMRWRIAPHLSPPHRARLAQVDGLPAFPAFFAVFSRCDAGPA